MWLIIIKKYWYYNYAQIKNYVYWVKINLSLGPLHKWNPISLACFAIVIFL